MNINQDISGLIHLQGVDSRLQEVEEKMGELQKTVQEMRAPLNQLEERKDDLLVRIPELRQEMLSLEQSIQEYGDKTQKSRDKLPLITTQKEYFALQKEIETMQKEKSKLEEDLLGKMAALDELQKEKDEVLSQCRVEEETFLRKKQEMENQNIHFDSEHKELKLKREGIAGGINPKYLNHYNKILRHKGPPALVRIIDGNCQGCHVTLPPQLYNDVRKAKSIITCSFCGRILYAEK